MKTDAIFQKAKEGAYPAQTPLENTTGRLFC